MPLNAINKEQGSSAREEELTVAVWQHLVRIIKTAANEKFHSYGADFKYSFISFSLTDRRTFIALM